MPHIDIRRPLSIFLLALLLFNLANWLMPLTDPVEAIYGQVAKEMVERGDYLVYLLFFLSACLSSFFLGWQAGEKGRWLVRAAYALAGLAVLAKGPLGLALPGLVGLVYLIATGGWRRWRDLRLPSGLLIFAAVALPWYILIWQRQGSAFLLIFLGVHNYLRAVEAQAPKLNYWWYYLAMLPTGLLPWSGFLAHGFVLGWPRSRERTGGFFFLLWVLVVFVFFNLMATKYPTYLLPAFFPMSALIGAFLAGCWDEGYKMNRTAVALWHLPVMVALFLLPVTTFVTLRRLYPPDVAGAAAIPFTLLCLLRLAGLLWGIGRNRIRMVVVSLGLVGLLQAPILMGILVRS